MDAGESELEREWLESNRPRQLVLLLERLNETSPRKRRLAACACLRQVWGLFGGPARLVIEAAERFADGQADFEELSQARAVWASSGAERWVTHRDAKRVLEQTLDWLITADKYVRHADRFVFALRDVFGNPFRPISLQPYRSEDVLALAVGMYTDAAFERMDILADALEDAGCTEEVILAHCRTLGGHWRGCWVIDGILGKE